MSTKKKVLLTIGLAVLIGLGVYTIIWQIDGIASRIKDMPHIPKILIESYKTQIFRLIISVAMLGVFVVLSIMAIVAFWRDKIYFLYCLSKDHKNEIKKNAKIKHDKKREEKKKKLLDKASKL